MPSPTTLALLAGLAGSALAAPAPVRTGLVARGTNVTFNTLGGNQPSAISSAAAAASASPQATYDYLNITDVSSPLLYNATSPPLSGNNAKNGTNSTLAWPHQPAGGLLQDKPVYHVESNFDFQSLNLALNQELIELDLFNHGLAKFSDAEFDAAGVTAEYRSLLAFMAQQEIGHAQALSNIIGPERSAKQCTYEYPFETVPEFIIFSQLLTRFGESGVYGFLAALDSRPSAQILTQSIATEARQQMIFRQMQGLFPMPVWFETGISQSYAWTLLSPYIKSCPSNNPRIEWQNFPALEIANNPFVFGAPAISSNRSITAPGREIQLQWEAPGKTVGYDDLYKTSTVAGEPKYAAFISQLNVTYVPLHSYNASARTAAVYQPNGNVFVGDPQVNGTMFVSLVDDNPYLTPYNISLLNNHTVAGPALYFSG